jgi:hypothetical protein
MVPSAVSFRALAGSLGNLSALDDSRCRDPSIRKRIDERNPITTTHFIPL